MDAQDTAATVRAALEDVAAEMTRSSYRGWEWDDFLASPILRALSFGSTYAKRVFVQIGKYSPLNLRPLLLIPKLPSSKASGLAARGFLEAYRATGEGIWLERAEERLQWLRTNPCPGYSGLAWGNHFDFASRGGFFPKGLPTVVWTSHIGRAFRLAYEITGKEEYRKAVLSIARFIMRDLEHVSEPEGICIAYAPGRANHVHNSNLLGAVSLLRAWVHDRDPGKLATAARAFRWSLHHQNDDGSWYYGTGDQYRWVDNFHTAYVLDCLFEGRELAGEEAVPQSAIDRTYTYWARTFFLENGAPRYYHDSTYPLDIQCAAQAIESFAGHARTDPGALTRALTVFGWTEANLKLGKGRYFFERRERYRVPVVSVHWGQSTMLSALGTLLRAVHDHSPAG